MTLLDAAITYAAGGWHVFPLHNPTGSGCSCDRADCSKVGKHPRVGNWQQDASNDVGTVAKWWAQWPSANIGLRLDGLLVLDVDPKNGGFESLAALEQEHGALYLHARQRSGSGGWHYLFEPEDGVTLARGFRPGLDLLTGPGAYIVAAPSLHASGGRYAWINEPHPLSVSRDAIALTMAPPWLLSVALKPGRQSAGKRPAADRPSVESLTAKALDKVRSGEGRNNAALWLFCQARDGGYSRDEATALLLREFVAKANDAIPGDKFTLGEATATLRSAYTRPAREPLPQASEGLTKEIADEIKKEMHFARDAGGLLHCFEEGVYRPNGKRAVERAVKRICESREKTKAWSPELATRVEQWLLVDAPELWESPPLHTLNCRNGLLDIATRALRPHSPEYLSPVQIAASFDPEARCPHIESFIRGVFPSDAQGLAFELVGWAMLPDTSLQKSVLLIGEGANGKSVWLNLMLTFLGRENVSALSLHRIEADKFSAARLVGKLVNIGTDLPTAALAGTSVFKALTGGDPISAERKFEASFEFRPFVRLLFSANSAPRSDDSTHGFFRRWLVIPFNRTFDTSDPDHVPRAELDARLSDPVEVSGLLNKALDALPALRRGSFTESASTRAALAEFRQTTDPFGVWLDSATVEQPDAVIAKDELRRLYGQICQDNGRPIMRDVQFTGALKRLRPKVQPAMRRVNGRPTRVFVGLGLLTQDQEPSDGGLF